MSNFEILGSITSAHSSDQNQDTHISSLFGVLDSHDFGYKKTRAAKLAATLVREILEILREHTTVPSVGACFPFNRNYAWPVKTQELYENGQFEYGACGNKNACPHCARRHGAICRKRLFESLSAYFGQGCIVWTQTLDLGFESGIPSRQRYKIISHVFTALLRLTSVARLRRKHNIAYFRVIEETLVEGVWTPHMHLVWVFRPGTNDQDAADFMDLLSRSWRKQGKKVQGVVESKRSIFSQPLVIENVEITVWYLQKSFWLDAFMYVDENYPIIRPLDYLVHFVKTGDMESLERWKEYEWASFRLHKYKFSKNWLTPC